MIALLAVALVLAVCGFVVLPLLRPDLPAEHGGAAPAGELWNREKAVAVLAIVEADFDRATGKLSEEDYRVLRSDYEGRALQAMDELRRGAETSATGASAAADPAAFRFCGACGTAFGSSDRFCASCGGPRGAA